MPNQVKLSNRDVAALDEFVRGVKGALGANLLRLTLFGSKATGRDAPDSDIDVLVAVERRDARVEDAVLDAAFEANLAYGVYISPRVVAKATLEDPVWRITPFLRAIEREGVLL